MTFGGRRVPISWPRVRTADDTAEIALDSYQEFASENAHWPQAILGKPANVATGDAVIVALAGDGMGQLTDCIAGR